jgi:hypothetical protein
MQKYSFCWILRILFTNDRLYLQFFVEGFCFLFIGIRQGVIFLAKDGK